MEKREFGNPHYGSALPAVRQTSRPCLLFAPEADDVAVRVADGSPVAHSAADGLSLLQDPSAEALGLLLGRRYSVDIDVEGGCACFGLLAELEASAHAVLGGSEHHVLVAEQFKLPAEESGIELLGLH